MASKQTVHMNHGEGDTSYARNSGFQRDGQNLMRPLIEAAILDLCGNSTLMPTNIVVADLGCSSGPNGIALVSIAIEAIHNQCLHFQQPPSEVCILLNDLPGNDFNTMVKSLVTLQKSNDPIVTTAIVPGSFYERLFISGSLNLVCSSSSLHWLSKAPENLMKNHIPAYEFDEQARRETLPVVLEAYAHQFNQDFTRFLKLRCKELVPQGRMVFSLLGKRSDKIGSKLLYAWEMLAQILLAMASDGMLNKEKFNSFCVPMYGPTDEELRGIIRKEGSFLINEMHVLDITMGVDVTPRSYANMTRAAYEPIVLHHFGDVMDDFMRTAEQRWSLEGSLHEELAKYPEALLVVSLTKV